MKSKHYSLILVSIFGLVFLTGCPPKKKMKIDEKVEATPTPTPEETPSTDASANAIPVIGQNWTEVPMLAAVHFDYNSSSISDADRLVLKNNVSILKKIPATVSIRVEGHCDDRGTVEYNLALGQKRANAVRSFYSASGIAKSRLQTISYGEERLVCNEQTEACWANNRRGTTTLRSATPVTLTPELLK